ncbi:hypothetical protein QQ045_000699 [Rhodiola kirilowii]
MEEKKKLNFVRNGVAMLPPGFRFEPTDEDLVFQYLKCKVFDLPLPVSVIPEINVCQYDPWDLPGAMEQDKYFFYNKKISMSRLNHKGTSSGFWKSIGENKFIISSKTADHWLVGLRKTMAFSIGDAQTDWIMHEYHLIFTCSSAHCKSDSLKNLCAQSFLMIEEGWTICHIMKNIPVSHKSMTINKRTRNIEYTGGLKFSKLNDGGKIPPPTSSSSSSYSSSSCNSITEKSSAESDTEESSC